MPDPDDQHSARVAVIIPFFRQGATLPDAVASVFAQTRQADEIVVVDDATPLSEAETLRHLPTPVRVVRLATNRGVGAARQFGVESTSSELLAFLDGDDWWDPRFLEMTAARLTAAPGAPAVYTGIVSHHPQRAPVTYDDKPAMLTVREAIVRSHALTSGMLIRRSALNAIGGWCNDRRVIDDWDLIVRLLDGHGPMPFVPMPLAHYRIGNPKSQNARHLSVLRRWARTVRHDRALLERHYGPGADRRRLAQAFEDRHDRVGGWWGKGYGFVSRCLGIPLRDVIS